MSRGLEAFLCLDDETRRRRGLFHTPAEIAAQPATWVKTAEAMGGHAGPLGELLAGACEVILTGAGSSYFIGKSLEKALASRLNRRVTAIASTEIILDPQGTLPDFPFLLVSFARSGNSPEGNAVFETADRLRPGKVRHIVITCNADGVLASLARKTASPAVLWVLPPETNDQGLAMTNSFTSMFVAGLGLGYLEDVAEYRQMVERMAQAGRQMLRHAPALGEVAGYPIRRAFFVGSGALYGAALEAHLKVQELSDGLVVGKAEDVLGLRHGPMAAIDASTLVVLLAPSDPYPRLYVTDLLRELDAKRLGMQRLIVCGRAEADWAGLAHRVLEFDPADSLALSDPIAPPVHVIAGQLLGLFISTRLGLTPDAPSRDGVIHRVVQGVRIHPYEPD